MAHRDDGAHTGDWFTSSYSDNQGGQCVQARRLGPASRMAVRDSKNPGGSTFEFGGAAWMDFIAFATQGEPSP
ncbi:DUF397 domain-containing protein [Streptomyces tendae]|uniref:DUF397 domain-containing protein n=1 Tax=Streptomyces tendae TaxID=1932 RepID=UPI00378EDC34